MDGDICERLLRLIDEIPGESTVDQMRRDVTRLAQQRLRAEMPPGADLHFPWAKTVQYPYAFARVVGDRVAAAREILDLIARGFGCGR